MTNEFNSDKPQHPVKNRKKEEGNGQKHVELTSYRKARPDKLRALVVQDALVPIEAWLLDLCRSKCTNAGFGTQGLPDVGQGASRVLYCLTYCVHN